MNEGRYSVYSPEVSSCPLQASIPDLVVGRPLHVARVSWEARVEISYAWFPRSLIPDEAQFFLSWNLTTSAESLPNSETHRLLFKPLLPPPHSKPLCVPQPDLPGRLPAACTAGPGPASPHGSQHPLPHDGNSHIQNSRFPRPKVLGGLGM